MKQWKQGNTIKQKYLEVEKKSYEDCFPGQSQSKKENVMQQDNQKFDACKIPQKMVKANQDIINGQCIRNDNGVPTVSDEDKEMA